MNIEDVKQIPIADYLHSLGYSPVKQQGNGLWYKSPLREEHEPSFKVNTDRNLWYDFGAGKGGNIIALAKELYCSVTWRDGVSISNWQKENVRNSILPITADRSLLSVSRT